MGTKYVIKDKTFQLEGYQSAFKPGKFGTCKIDVIVDQATIDALEGERDNLIQWKISKQTDPTKWVVARNTKWSDVSKDKYKISFSWKPEDRPPFVDTQGTLITEEIPLYSGSKVKIAFDHYPYPDNVRREMNTTCKLTKLQVISCNSGAGVDDGDADFGTTEGFKIGAPNVTPTAEVDTNDDF
jgi:hypothetical protein